MNSPRLYAGIHGPMMKVISDSDYLTPEMRRKWRIYEEFYDVYDAGFACSARLANAEGLSIVVASLRSRIAGDFAAEDRRAFESLLPHIRAAFDVQMAVGSQAINLTLKTLESISFAGLVCDPTGKLLACSPGGEALLAEGRFLRLQLGIIRTSAAECAASLANALARAGLQRSLSNGGATSIILRDRFGLDFRRVEVSPLPRDLELSLGPAVLLVARDENSIGSPDALTQYGLSKAEARVAHAAALGRSPREIAVERGVSHETIKSQLKAIYGKLDVRSVTQMAAKLSGKRV
jgi:DNA-binding CsgD family transcriptional regulator